VKWNGISYLVVIEMIPPKNSPRHHKPPPFTFSSNYISI